MKKSKISDEEMKSMKRESDLKDLKERIDNGSIPKNPTRFFKVGDAVAIGALKNIRVTEVLFDGLAYAVHYEYVGKSYGKDVEVVGDGMWDWISVFPITSFNKGESFCIKDDITIRYYNNDIDSLMHKGYHSGVDFNPNYQRDLVWSLEQKESLLNSIFNNIEIGKFTFIKHEYSSNRIFHYEILDGKQRLSTILEYYEGRFSYKGKKFTELSWSDARHFKSFPIIQGEVSDISEQQIYKLFLKMNTAGEPIKKEHLDRIKSLIK